MYAFHLPTLPFPPPQKNTEIYLLLPIFQSLKATGTLQSKPEKQVWV